MRWLAKSVAGTCWFIPIQFIVYLCFTFLEFAVEVIISYNFDLLYVNIGRYVVLIFNEGKTYIVLKL